MCLEWLVHFLYFFFSGKIFQVLILRICKNPWKCWTIIVGFFIITFCIFVCLCVCLFVCFCIVSFTLLPDVFVLIKVDYHHSLARELRALTCQECRGHCLCLGAPSGSFGCTFHEYLSDRRTKASSWIWFLFSLMEKLSEPTFSDTHTHTQTCLDTLMYTHTHTHTPTHIYIHSHTHTHHTYMHSKV